MLKELQVDEERWAPMWPTAGRSSESVHAKAQRAELGHRTSSSNFTRLPLFLNTAQCLFLHRLNMFSRMLSSSVRVPSAPKLAHIRHSPRHFHTTRPAHSPTALNNILAGGAAPAVQVKTITSQGIELADGLIIPSACIFLNGKTFLWDIPGNSWEGWKEEHFEVFDVVVPKPGAS